MNPVPPLCPCGVRGCPLEVQHRQAFVVIPTRRHRGGSKRPRRDRP